MKRGRQTTVMALLVVGVIVLGGCGGSSGGKRLTKAEFKARVNALCEDHDKNKSHDSPQSEKELLAVIVRDREAYARFFAGLKKLRPPLTAQPTVDRIARLSKVVLKYHDDGRKALETHKGDPFENAARYDTTISEIVRLLYSKLGATSCNGI